MATLPDRYGVTGLRGCVTTGRGPSARMGTLERAYSSKKKAPTSTKWC